MKLNKIPLTNAALKAESMKTTKSIENMEKIIDQTIFGEFEWRIDSWSEKSTKARNGKDKELFSDSFLSHPNGYKICLTMRHDGYYLDIGFCILSGPFDSVLKWPFDRDAEFSLINQKTGLAHKTLKFECSKNSTHVALQKPKDESKNKSISNYPLISPQEISEVCRNDQIIIKFRSKPI